MRLYIFDLDNTLLTKNCSFKYYSYLYKKKSFTNISLLRVLKYLVQYSYFNLSPTDLHKKVFKRFIKGKTFDEIFGNVDEFLDNHLDEMVNKKVFSYIERAKKENDFVIVLSNSPEYLAVPLTKRLNIGNCRGSTYEIDDKKRFIKIANIMDGKTKAKYTAKKGENAEEIVVFTDSIWDRPLLEIANKCYVVNPDKKLYALAKMRKWFFL